MDNDLAGHIVGTWEDLVLFLDGSPTSFTGQLVTLIEKADPGNRARLREAFPRQVAAWEMWCENAPLTRGQLEDLTSERLAADHGARLRERLTAAEEVCLVFGWTRASMATDHDKALHELWRRWCDVSGVSFLQSDHPELGDDRLAELARKRDEARTRTLAAIRELRSGPEDHGNA